MLSEEYSLSPSSSSSSSSSPSSPSISQPPGRPSPKRKAGRKKFRETRHPVYHGVRARSGGRWVSEAREPRQKGRIWLGTFPTPEMAARAHDVAAIALRGASAAQLNFADSATALPRATSAAPHDVRRAAAEAAEMYRSSKRSSPPQQPPDAAVRRDEETRAAVAPVVFVDEEAVFNMPELMEDMARGMMVTPPAMQRGFDWHNVDGGEECVVDLSLWSD